MANINCMKMSGPGEIPGKQAQEFWVDALTHARDVSKAAKVVIGSKIACIEYIHDALEYKWEKRLRVRARFNDNTGHPSLINTMQFTESMGGFKEEIPDIEWLRHSTHTLLRTIVAEGVVVAKLALVNADAISDMAEVMAEEGSFSPANWSNKIVDSYITKSVVTNLAAAKGDNTDFIKRRNDALAMGEAAKQFANTDPAFREQYR